MKKISCVILGYGDRSSRYADYAKQMPDELEVVGIIDVNDLKRRQGKEIFDLQEEQIFENLDEFLKADIKCDVVINGTMDQLHYITTMPLLEKGYNILLEKPITSNPEELLAIEEKAKEKGCKVVVCHVLRYTPFYSKIKSIIDSGKIGKIVDGKNVSLDRYMTQHFQKGKNSTYMQQTYVTNLITQNLQTQKLEKQLSANSSEK